MDYIKPHQLVEDVAAAGAYKASLSIKDILIKGVLSGAFLGFATTLAYTAATETKLGIVGAFVFPVGFVLILLLGLELVTGNFAILPLARLRELTTREWVTTFLGISGKSFRQSFIWGSVLYSSN